MHVTFISSRHFFGQPEQIVIFVLLLWFFEFGLGKHFMDFERSTNKIYWAFIKNFHTNLNALEAGSRL